MVAGIHVSGSKVYLDSCASKHMVNDLSLIRHRVRDSSAGFTTGEKDTSVRSTHRGTMDLRTDKGIRITISNVYYVPLLRQNLVSLPQLTAKGMMIQSVKGGKPGDMLITNGKGKIVMNVHHDMDVGCMILTGVQAVIHELEKEKHGLMMVNDMEPDINTYHRRLGHLSEGGIKDMIRANKNGLIPARLLHQTLAPCEICAISKAKSLPFRKERGEQQREKMEFGDRFDSDIGVMPRTSRFGSNYDVHYIDFKTRYRFLFMMKKKNEQVDKYKYLRALMRTQFGKIIKKLCVDGEPVYMSNEMLRICGEDGTILWCRAPHTPQQNPIAERSMGVLHTGALANLIQSGLTPPFWEDSVLYQNYVGNRTPTKVLKGASPHLEVWGLQPDFKYLRPFGCLCFVFIPSEFRKKFDQAAVPGAFLGYSLHHSAYKVYVWSRRKDVTSRNVKFFENVFPYREGYPKDQMPKVSEEFWEVERDEAPSMNEYAGLKIQPVPSGQLDIKGKITEPSDDRPATPPPAGEVDMPKTPVKPMIPSTPPGFSKEPSPGRNIGSKMVRSRRSNMGVPGLRYEDTGFVMAEEPKEKDKEEEKEEEEEEEESKEKIDWGKIDPKTVVIPKNIKDLENVPYAKEWRWALKEELTKIHGKNTFRGLSTEEMLKVSEKEVRVTGNRVIFSTKFNGDGTIERFKARLVLQGYNHTKGVEYEQTYAPVVAMESVRFLMAMAASNGWEVDHLDVPTAFLNGEIEHLIITKVPNGWNKAIGSDLGQDGDPIGLSKSLYGAKQAGLCWNKKTDESAKAFGFERSTSDTCVYHLWTNTGVVIFAIWTDDYFLTGSDMKAIQAWKQRLYELFDIKDKGRVSFALGIRFSWSTKGLFMDQKKMINDMAETFNMKGTKGTNIPMPHGTILTKDMAPETEEEKRDMEDVPFKSLIGSLLYVARVTRPDVMFAVSFLSRFSSNPGRKHWTVAQGILKYLIGTSEMGLMYRKGNWKGMRLDIDSWPDSSYADDREKGKSTYGHVSYLNECAFAWQSTLSRTVPQSVFEAEIIAANEATKLSVGYKWVCDEVHDNPGTPVIHVDNDPAVFFAENAIHTRKSRHMMPKFYYIREQVEEGNIRMARTKTEDQHGDIMTKILGKAQFIKFRTMMGVGPQGGQ
jgi:hypothetical protein